MGFNIPRGTQDILPENRNAGNTSKRLREKRVMRINIKKSGRLFLNIQNYFPAGWENRLISCKRKCIHSQTKKEEA